MRLPEVRDAMHQLANALKAPKLTKTRRIELADEIETLAEQTRRRSPIKRAAPKAAPMTQETKDRIRQTAHANPDWSFRRIGRECNVDQGRVSEVLRGFRK